MNKLVMVLKPEWIFDTNSEATSYIKLPTGSVLQTNYNKYDGFHIRAGLTSMNGNNFHVGAWLRIKLPIVGLYVRPEIIYTALSNNYFLEVPYLLII